MGRMTENEARDILEIGPYATPKDVKTAYKRLALDCNPDYTEATPESARQFRRINAAYDRLTKDNVDDEDIDRGTYVDGRRFGIFRGVVISDRHVTRVHTDDGFFFILGPLGQFSDSDDEFDSSQYSFKLMEGNADEQAKTKAEKNKLKKQRKKENKKQARENFLKERQQIKNERQKTLEESRTTPKEKTDIVNPRAICYGEANEEDQSVRNNLKIVSGQKKEKTSSNGGSSKANAPQKLKNATKVQNRENPAGNFKKTPKVPVTPTSKPPEVTTTKQNMRSTEKETSEKSLQENDKHDTEEFDVDCAFFAKVAQKRKPSAAGGTKPKTKQLDNYPKFSSQAKQKSEEKINHSVPTPAQVQAQKTATEGNKMASEKKFDEAIKLYSQSHLLNPIDYRLLGNRSFCFEKLKDFEKALADAEKCISLAPTWSKGYFRKGRALLGMTRLAEAERAFEHVLKIDKHCYDAESELNDVRVKRLQEMGFSKQQSFLALKKYYTVDQAVDAMLSGAIPNVAVEDVYVSDEDDISDDNNNIEVHTLQPHFLMGQTQAKRSQNIPEVDKSPANAKTNQNFSLSNQRARQNPGYFKNIAPRLANVKPVIAHDSSTHGTQDYYNPGKRIHSGVYVGNLKPQVKEESLKKYFGQFGTIQNIQNRGYYGYVNYFNLDSARLALESAEVVTIDGVSLNLDYPGDRANLCKDKNTSNSTPNYQQRNGGRQECFNWRGSGCRFGPDCRYLHLPEHQGIDMR